MGKCILFVFLSVLVLTPQKSFADTLSFTGNFSADNDIWLYNLGLGTGGVVTVQTWSYAGGTNGNGSPISSGGFAPELTLFDSTGNLLAIDNVGGTAPSSCGLRNIDTTTGFCQDAFISLVLLPGAYTIALTQQGNNPMGLLADGFSQDAANANNPSFTGDNAGMPGEMFIDPGDFSQRSSNWALDITFPSATAVPEPSSLLLLLCGSLAGTPFAVRRLSIHRKKNN